MVEKQLEQSLAANSSFTLKLLKEFDRVIEERPDPQTEVYDRLREFDRRQAEHWKGRILDDEDS